MTTYTIDLDFFAREYASRDFEGLLEGLRELTVSNGHIEARVALALWLHGWHERNAGVMTDYDGCYLAYARALAGLGELYMTHSSRYHDVAYHVGRDLLDDVYNDVDNELYTKIIKAL